MKKICFCWMLVCLVVGACASASPAPNELKEWDLLWISDSTGFGAPDLLAQAIERERGIKVRVHDVTTGSLSAERVLNVLKGSDESHAMLSQIRSLIPQAEMIVLLVNPSINGKHEIDECMGGERLTKSCTAASYTRYRADLDLLIKEIFRLRAGTPTLVRTYEVWLRPAWWKADNCLEPCLVCVNALNTAIAEVSAANQIPMARITDLFNGKNHDEDPEDKGFIGVDGIHASLAGAKAIAEAILALGYEPVKP